MTYNPIDGKPDRVHIGARSLELDDWIEIDEHYAKEVTLKHKLLKDHHSQVFVSIPQGDAGSNETLELLLEHLPRVFPERWLSGIEAAKGLHPLQAASLLVQEDLCVMSQIEREWILTAACVCFPSRWDLTKKIGQSLDGIHGPVPHYAERIGVATQNLFDKLTVERPIWRVNWTMLDTPDLHQPVASTRADSIAITPENVEDQLYFRRERQTLRKLPKTGDILFTIHTYANSLREMVREYPEFRKNLGLTLGGASIETIGYKGWVKIIEDVKVWSQK